MVAPASLPSLYDALAPVYDRWQRSGDELVRQTVETITSYAAFVELERQRERLCQRVLRSMERRIEACDLRQRGRLLRDRANGRQIMWLMQRRQWNERFQLAQNRVIDTHRPFESNTAVNDAMADSGDAVPRKIMVDEMQQERRRTDVIECARWPCTLADDDTCRIARDELRLFGQPFDLPADVSHKRGVFDRIHRELDAR